MPSHVRFRTESVLIVYNANDTSSSRKYPGSVEAINHGSPEEGFSTATRGTTAPIALNATFRHFNKLRGTLRWSVCVQHPRMISSNCASTSHRGKNRDGTARFPSKASEQCVACRDPQCCTSGERKTPLPSGTHFAQLKVDRTQGPTCCLLDFVSLCSERGASAGQNGTCLPAAPITTLIASSRSIPY